MLGAHEETEVQRREGADARSPGSSQEQAVFEAPNPEVFGGETAALGTRGRQELGCGSRGWSWAQNSGEETGSSCRGGLQGCLQGF